MAVPSICAGHGMPCPYGSRIRIARRESRGCAPKPAEDGPARGAKEDVCSGRRLLLRGVGPLDATVAEAEVLGWSGGGSGGLAERLHALDGSWFPKAPGLFRCAFRGHRHALPWRISIATTLEREQAGDQSGRIRAKAPCPLTSIREAGMLRPKRAEGIELFNLS